MSVSVGRNDPCPCGSGKKYKNCCLNKKSFYDEYREMLASLTKCNSAETRDEILYYGQQVINIGNSLISRNETTPMLTGTYTNMCQAYYLMYRLDDEDDTYLRKSIVSAQHALELKPTNQVATGALIRSLLRYHDYNAAIIALEKCHLTSYSEKTKEDDATQFNYLMVYIGTSIVIIDYLSSLNEEQLQGLETFLTALLETYQNEDVVHFLVAEFYFYTGRNTTLAEANYTWCIKSKKEKSLLKTTYHHLGTLYISMSPDYYEKGLALLEESLKLAENDKELWQLQQVYTSALNKVGQPQKAEEILQVLIQNDPCDNNYYNLARSFELQGKLDEAYDWAQKAVFVVEEEQNLLLIADICKKKKQYSESIEYYEKAIAFIKDGNNAITYTNDDGLQMLSYANGRAMSETLEILYDGIITAYAKTNQFDKASIYVSLAEKEFPYSTKWEVYHELLPDIEATEAQIEQQEIELRTLRDQCKTQQNVIRKWAMSLMELQNRSIDFDLDNPSDWSAFENGIDNIIKAMKSASSSETQLFEKTKQQFQREFSMLDSDSIEFLATAETLYQLHKNSTIDFAAIVIEFCKVIEKQLRRLLGKRLPGNIKMLGQVIYEIENQPIPPYNRLLQELNKVNKLRKKSAHTGTLKKVDVEELRRLFFSEGLLSKLQ